MHTFISFVIFVSSVTTWVAAATDTAFAKSSYENFDPRTRKLVQKTNYDSWSKKTRKTFDINYKTDIPKEFDARQYFVNCANVIGDVKDQGNCASSWAVAVASTFTDRLCIATNGTFTQNLSAQNLMSCGDDEKLGCNGGSAFKAWEFITGKGIVTGGNFDSNEGCQPYKNRPCDHYGDSGMTNCSSLRRTPMTICREKCINKNYKVKYDDDLHKTSVNYITSWTNVTQIQQEIMTYGPVTALMYVYENFVGYKKGVYKSTVGDLIGYHHVKLIGWGVDNDGNEYWLAMNSWNSNWGENGLFKILRGYNFCSIELLVMAGIADVSQP